MILSDLSLCLPPTPLPALARHRVWYSAALAATIKIGLAGFCAFSRVRCLAPPLKPMRLPQRAKTGNGPRCRCSLSPFSERSTPRNFYISKYTTPSLATARSSSRQRPALPSRSRPPSGRSIFSTPMPSPPSSPSVTQCSSVRCSNCCRSGTQPGKPLAWRRPKPRKHGVLQQNRPLWP